MTELNFTEVEPLGPQVHGDLDLGQLHDSWSRRVAAEFTGDQTYWAVITWSWYQCELADGTIVLLREEEYMITTDSPTRPGDGEEFSDYRYPEPLAPGEKSDELLAKRAAAEVNLSLMTWPAEMMNKIEIWRQI
jgi:hypothetical protein